MATGIVSVALHSDGQEILSRVLLVLTAGARALLGAVFLTGFALSAPRR